MQKNLTPIPYLEIFGKAFLFTWKNRYLWWFGFFLTLANIGGFNYFYGDAGKNPTSPVMENLSRYSQWIFIGILFALVIIIALAILGLLSRGALISSVEKINRNQPTDFKASFKEGKKYFWKIFSISIFSGLFIFAALLILAPPVAFLFLNHNYFLGGVMATLAVIIFIPLLILVFYLKIFGNLYAVLGGLKPWAAIESAYNLFRKNIRPSILVAVFFIPIGLLFFLLVIFTLIPIAFVVLPLALLFFLLVGPFGAAVAGIIGLILLAICIFFLRAVLEVFFQTVWILFFHEIAAPKEKEIATESVVEIKILPETSLPTINSEKE